MYLKLMMRADILDILRWRLEQQVFNGGVRTMLSIGTVPDCFVGPIKLLLFVCRCADTV